MHKIGRWSKCLSTIIHLIKGKFLATILKNDRVRRDLNGQNVKMKELGPNEEPTTEPGVIYKLSIIIKAHTN